MESFPQVTCLSVIYIDSESRLQDIKNGLFVTLRNIAFADLDLVVVQECSQYDKICEILDDQGLNFRIGPNHGKWSYWQEGVRKCRTPFLLEIDFDIQAEPRHLRNLLRAIGYLNIFTGGKGCICSYAHTVKRNWGLPLGEVLLRCSGFEMHDVIKALFGGFRLSCVRLAKQIPYIPLKCGYGTDIIYTLALEKTGLAGCWITDPNPATNVIQHQTHKKTKVGSQVNKIVRKFESLWSKHERSVGAQT